MYASIHTYVHATCNGDDITAGILQRFSCVCVCVLIREIEAINNVLTHIQFLDRAVGYIISLFGNT